MYVSASMVNSEIGDHDVTVVDGRIHLHHLCLPNHDVVGHAVSEDGLKFTPAPAAIRTGDPGECDDDMIWTMHTVQHPKTGQYLMYYTACSLAEYGEVQRVALAVSDDFIHWRKYDHNPILVAAAPHYLDRLESVGRIPFRDPFVFIDDDGSWHMLVCAQTARGDRLRRGCVAHAVSSDGFHWDLCPPLYAPAQYDDLEVPALIKKAGKYYLFFHEFRSPRTFYRIADSLNGPWRTPEWDEPLPPDNSVTRFCEWQGQTLVYTWFRCSADWPCRNPKVHAILPPKEVHTRPDGRLLCSTFSGWRERYEGAMLSLPPNVWTPREDSPGSWQTRGQRLEGAAVGLGIAAAVGKHTDFVFDIIVTCERGRALGLLFRAGDDLESGNWIRLDFERRRVELHRLQPRDTGVKRFVRMQPSVKQAWDYPLVRGQAFRLHGVASREYIELSIDDQVCLSLVDYARTEGRFGLFVEDAAGAFQDMTVQAIRPVNQI